MMLWFNGSMAIDPVASEHWVSVSGVQEVPPLMLFQTPPCAAPTYMMSGLVGSMAIAVTRPASPPPIGAGPSAVHELTGLAAAAPNEKYARWRFESCWARDG